MSGNAVGSSRGRLDLCEPLLAEDVAAAVENAHQELGGAAVAHEVLAEAFGQRLALVQILHRLVVGPGVHKGLEVQEPHDRLHHRGLVSEVLQPVRLDLAQLVQMLLQLRQNLRQRVHRMHFLFRHFLHVEAVLSEQSRGSLVAASPPSVPDMA
eukprot:2963065-Rhodomonas_salina.3